MSLLNTDIGPERVQVFDQPLGTAQVAGAAISNCAMLISTSKAGAPVNVPTSVTNMDEFETSFGDVSEVADDGWYAARGFFDNAGTGAEAIIVNVGEGTKEETSVVCVADVSGSLNSTFWRISSAYDRTDYYVWYDVDGAGVDPSAANPGRTGVKVSIATDDTAITVAQATQAAVDALDDFTSPATVSATATVTNATGGPSTDSEDGSAPTGFTISTPTQGARPTASDYIGDASAGSGLRALDTVDTVGMVAIPGLPLETAYSVDGSLIDYTETVRAEFGAVLSTSFSLLAAPKEITQANKDVQVGEDLTIASIVGMVVTVNAADLSAMTPGMVVKKAGALKAVVTEVDATANTLTLTTVSGLATSDTITVSVPSAVNYKDFVVNNPSRVSAWYFNNLLVNTAVSGESGVVTVDPTGHVAGVIARIDANRQIGGHSHAPAGIQFAGVAGIQGLSLALSERSDAEPLRLAFINRITSFPGSGNIIFGGYTAGGSAVTADEQLIQVMRSLQYIKASLEPGLRGFLWENFSPLTQERIASAILAFLRNNSHLFPAGLPENQQFKVISVTPTQNELDQGLLKVRIQVKPNKAVRFIEITLEYPLPTV